MTSANGSLGAEWITKTRPVGSLVDDDDDDEDEDDDDED